MCRFALLLSHPTVLCLHLSQNQLLCYYVHLFFCGKVLLLSQHEYYIITTQLSYLLLSYTQFVVVLTQLNSPISSYYHLIIV